jgi:hypothetical protein
MDIVATHPPNVYLASPIATYYTLRYDRMRAHVERLFPGAAIVAARGLYRNSADFLRRWPTIRHSLSTLVFFTDEQQYIGYGVFTEIRDARDGGLPVFFLTDDGILHALDDVILGQPNEDDWRRYMRVSVTEHPAVSP